MKKTAIAILLLTAACASSDTTPAPAGAPAGDPRIGELQTSMTELLERLDVLNDRVAHLEQAAEERPAPVAVERRASSPASAAQAPPPAAASRPLASAQIADQYRAALVLYGKNQMAEARKAFQQVFDTDPSGDLADNSLFWIGETWYAAGNWGEAMRFYKRVADEYGEQNKAPDALYKLALVYEKSGDLILARTALQDVIRRYPYSTPAAAAKAELNRIKY